MLRVTLIEIEHFKICMNGSWQSATVYSTARFALVDFCHRRQLHCSSFRSMKMKLFENWTCCWTVNILREQDRKRILRCSWCMVYWTKKYNKSHVKSGNWMPLYIKIVCDIRPNYCYVLLQLYFRFGAHSWSIKSKSLLIHFVASNWKFG